MTEQNRGAHDVESPPTGRHAATDDALSEGTDGAATTSVPAVDPAADDTSRTTETSPPDAAQSTDAAQNTDAAQSTDAAQNTDATPAAAPVDAPTEQVAAPTEAVAAQPPPPAQAPPPSEPETQRVAAPADPATRQMPEPVVAQGPAKRSGGAGRVVRSVAARLATLLRLAGALCALILVVFIVLAVAAVNEDNAIAQVVASAADVLVLDFRDLFLPADPRVMVGLNYGLAAVFWLVVAGIAASIVRRLAALVP